MSISASPAILSRALAIQGWMQQPELEWLAEHARDCALIVEIGAWKGRSSRVFLDNSSADLVVVDRWPDEACHGDETKRYLGDYPGDAIARQWADNLADGIDAGRVKMHRGWSRHSAEHVWQLMGRKRAYLLFIDGGHDYEDCLDDIALYRGLVKDGGIIAGHDYSEEFPGVKRAADEYFGKVQHGAGTIWWVQL